MTLDLTLVGQTFGPAEKSWTSDDTLRYALGVGAGLGDPLRELEFTTENSQDITQKVLPTYATVLQAVRGLRPPLGDFNPAKLVHAEQSFDLRKPIPVEGSVSIMSTITGMFDKGKGALVTTSTDGIDKATGEQLFASTSNIYISGEGGFGGESGPADTWARPERDPDHVVEYQTRPEQALLYRLSGDRNPLHSDPKFAARGGFERPILHGLCSYGFTGRGLLHSAFGGDPEQFGGMEARFSAPILPGDTITVLVWEEGDEVLFQSLRGDGKVILDRGRARRMGSAA